MMHYTTVTSGLPIASTTGYLLKLCKDSRDFEEIRGRRRDNNNAPANLYRRVRFVRVWWTSSNIFLPLETTRCSREAIRDLRSGNAPRRDMRGLPRLLDIVHQDSCTWERQAGVWHLAFAISGKVILHSSIFVTLPLALLQLRHGYG